MGNEKMREAFACAFAEEIQRDRHYVLALWNNEHEAFDDIECQMAWNMWQVATAATQRDAMAVAEAVQDQIHTAFSNHNEGWTPDECLEVISKLDLAAIVEAVQPGKPEPVNQQLLAALKRYDIEVEGKQIYRVGSPDGRYVLFDDVAAVVEAAQPIVKRDSDTEAGKWALTWNATLVKCAHILGMHTGSALTDVPGVLRERLAASDRQQDADDDRLQVLPAEAAEAELPTFKQWWEDHGQFVRAGGGQYESCFAWSAWQAAIVLGRTVPGSQQQGEPEGGHA